MSRVLFTVLLACGVGWGALSASAGDGIDGSRFPDEAKIAFEQGEALQEAGRYKDAITAYVRSLRYKREYLDAFNNIAVCYTTQRKYKQAITYYKKSLWLNPKQVKARTALGLLYVQRKQWARAEAEHKLLHGLDPNAATWLAKRIEQARVSKRDR